MRVHSIFLSVAGEVNHLNQGIPSLFIRLQGCNLCCHYCDAPDAQKLDIGRQYSLVEMAERISKFPTPFVTFTGGEPLLQAHTIAELHRLMGFPHFSIETNGSISPKSLNPQNKYGPLYPFGFNIHYVMDYKLPSSGMEDKMNLKAFEVLGERDWVKFVIQNEEDYAAAKVVVKTLLSNCRARFAMSPVYDLLPAKELLSWMLKDKLYQVTLNVQLHKYIEVE